MIVWLHDAAGRFIADSAACRVQRRGEGDTDDGEWAVDEMHGDGLGATEVRRFATLQDALDWARLTYGDAIGVRRAP